MGRMAQIAAARLLRALGRLGWTVDRRSGSHVVLVKPGRSPITVPVHGGKTLKEGTARAIVKQAGISEEELFDVYGPTTNATPPWRGAQRPTFEAHRHGTVAHS